MTDFLPRARRLLHDGVGPVFPGAVLLVAVPGRPVAVEAAGACALPGLAGPANPVRPDTVFDVASLTKPLATTAVLMTLVAEGRLSVTDTLGDRLPGLAGTDKGAIDLASLLAHSSGMPAWRPFGEDIVRALGEAAAGTEATRAEVARRVAAEALESPPGTSEAYSDLGFMLLGRVVEAAAEARLDEAFASRIAGPLRLARSFFVPIEAGRAEACPVPVEEVAATERCPTRGRVLRGEVHDDNAFVLGGVAPHAGLFSSAADVAREVSAMFDAWAGRRGVFDPGVVRAFCSARPLPGGTYVPGFDTPSTTGSSAGDRHPPRLVGHLGFTGTSFWLDLDSGTVVVLLTNRVHPTRANEAIKAFRPVIHDAVWDAL